MGITDQNVGTIIERGALQATPHQYFRLTGETLVDDEIDNEQNNYGADN
jgi:hypothetical protein